MTTIGTLASLGLVSLAIVLLWPRWGLIPWWRRVQRHERRARIEDALKHLYECELNGTIPTVQSVAWATQLSADRVAEVLQTVEERKLVEIRAGALRLTPEGRDLGLRVLRAHRLWESYLADRTAFPETEWHGRAHTLEHGLSNEQVDALAAQLQHPTHDPHGDPIPTADGQAERPDGIPIAEAPAGRALRVVHIEDEPDAVYSQLVAEGIFPGMMLRVAEMSVTRVRLISASSEHVLAPLVAANITVEVLPEEEALEPEGGVSLDTLAVGESGRVLSLSPRCRGAERRRLMDLGVLPGTILTVEMRSPSGDPTAYWIRGALIALRTEQASWLRVERVPHKDAEEAA